MYPAEAVPEGAVFAPHHYIYGLLLVVFVASVETQLYYLLYHD